MSYSSDQNSSVIVRLAANAAEIEAAQRLRYDVFYEEYGAKADDKTRAQRLDRDMYDEYAHHLVVVDECDGQDKIVGTYRLLLQDGADQAGQFYTSQEYDLSGLKKSGVSLMELGRSCVLEPYRTRPVLQLLWQGIADFVTDHNVGLMFGCASLHGTDVQALAEPLSYLHHFHSGPADLVPQAIESRYVDMNIIPKQDLQPRKAFGALPPLIKGYIRLGATIGRGAVVDEQFNTTDVCIVVQTHEVTQRYRKHYERKIQKSIPGGTVDSDNLRDQHVSNSCRT